MTQTLKTIIVTGGCGFIGSHFVRMVVAAGAWRVVNIDKLTYAGNLENLADIKDSLHYRFVRGDIADRNFISRVFEEEKPQAVVNFAAESHVDRSILDPGPFVRTNVTGVQILLDTARLSGVERFLQISTDEVYGDADGGAAFAEGSRLDPSSPYAASKAAGEILCPAYHRTYGLPTLVVRSSNNYGPNQFPEKLIPLTIRNAVRSEALPVYGDGLQKREWLFVEDNCRAILKVLERGIPGSIYNIGGDERTNIDVVRTICSLVASEAGRSLQDVIALITSVPDRPGHDRRYALNSTRIRSQLGWNPRVSFDNGLRETVRWYLDNEGWVERVVSGEYRNYYRSVYSKGWNQEPAP